MRRRAIRLRSILQQVRDTTAGTERRRAVTAGVVTALGLTLAISLATLLRDGSDERRVVAALTPTATPGGPWVKLDVPPEDNRFAMHATSEDAAGVRIDSQFIFTSTEAMSTKVLGGRLKTEPAVGFELQQVATGEVRIEPRAPLTAGQLYRFTLLAEDGERPQRSWAFQAQEPLRVVQTLPADSTSDVPLHTGIEVTFSHDGIAGYEERISIDPPVEGRFEQHKRVVVFVPKELQPRTLYTVTVRAGVTLTGSIATLSEDHVFRFETGGSLGEFGAPPSPIMQFSRRTFEMPPGEAPVLALFTSEPGDQLSASFTVYRFAGADEFVTTLGQFDEVPGWSRFAREAFAVDTAGLQQVAAFDGALQRIGRYGDLYVRFPEALPEGFYLVDARYGTAHAQGWLQITDIATYTSVSRTRLLVWANDLKTQGPMSGASVELADGSQLGATTGADGVAFFDTPQGFVELQPSEFGYRLQRPASDLVVRAPDGRMAVVPLGNVFNGYRYFGFREYGFFGDPGLYWRYVYTDRHLYLPTDTVHIWGLVRPREGAVGERDLTVRISGSSYDGEYQELQAGETHVRTNASGTYIGELPIFDVSPGYYSVSVLDGEQVVSSTYLEVRDYVKPAYTIEVTPSRQAVLDGEVVDFRIQANYFEGSPLPNALLAYTGSATGEVVTDARGVANVSAPVISLWSGGISVTPKLIEEGEIAGDAVVRTFPAGLTFDVEDSNVSDDGTAIIEGSVYQIDFDRLNRGDASRWEDPRGAVMPGRSLVADVVEVSYDRVEAGETYDFINKRVSKIYQYNERERPIGRFEAQSGSDGRFRFSWPAEADKNYRADVSAADDTGRRYSNQVGVYRRGTFSFGTYLSIEDVKAPPGSYSPYGGSPGGYATGEEVSLELRRSDADLPVGGANRFLFYRAQNGLTDYAIRSDPAYAFTFEADDAPSTSVMGVRFTGTTFEEANYAYTVPFDPAERKLTIAVEPDRERYEPGDAATLRVTTTDREGRPVAAEVLLSAVDEAVFAIEDQSSAGERDILQSLYTPVGSGILRTYASHFYPFELNAAERGGGGDQRTDFKDVALFDRVQTDGDGKGSVTFKLPDNLTSWRVTALGVSDGLLAGHALKQVPVGLPFFAELVANRDYLASDRVTLRVRGMGTALNGDDEVSFELSSASMGIVQPLRASGKAFAPVDLQLPELSEGRHELLLKATAGEHEDSLVRVINVLPSRLVQTAASFHELADGTQLEGSGDRATTVVFSDHGRGRYYPLLQQLSWTWGDRVDQMLARDLGWELLSEHFDEQADAAAEFQPSLYQRPDGAVAIFPYADGDLLLSARVADVAPDRFGRQTLAAYFGRVAADPKETRERTIIATYGLAALGEPVLSDVRVIAALPDLTWRERLYAGLSAAALGDDDTARRIYHSLLVQYGEQRGPWVRIKTGADEDEILEGTSLLAIMGASLGDALAAGIFGYTEDNRTRDVLVQLEQISYLRRALPRLPAEAVTIEYTLDGARKRESLGRGETFALRLSPDQLRDLEPAAVDGQVGVSTLFLAPLAPDDVAPDPAVSVTRRIEAVDGGPVEEGKLVRVTLHWDLSPAALDSCYQVSDLLPSGLRPVTRFHHWDTVGVLEMYPYAVLGQRVSFCIHKGMKAFYRPIVYYARVVSKGTYLAEPAIIQSQKAPESINITPAETIEIR